MRDLDKQGQLLPQLTTTTPPPYRFQCSGTEHLIVPTSIESVHSSAAKQDAPRGLKVRTVFVNDMQFLIRISTPKRSGQKLPDRKQAGERGERLVEAALLCAPHASRFD
jgi:hypothetical protein